MLFSLECSKASNPTRGCGGVGVPKPSREIEGIGHPPPRPRQYWIHFLAMGLGMLILSTNWVQVLSAQAVTESAPLGQDMWEQFSNAELADFLLSHMSVADRVGQLFVVPFFGSEIIPDDDILDLLLTYRVGGVILRERNQNLDNRPQTDTPRQVASLANQLQAAAGGYFVPAGTVQELPETRQGIPGDFAALALSSSDPPPAFSVPLLIGVSLREAGALESPLRHGFTPQPSQMALGATWDPTFARAMGTILGQELQAVGINLLLGPDLDVSDQAPPLPAGFSATAIFGGDSWWAGQNGKAFIHGAQEGSSGGLLVFPRHFPGQGGRDRQPSQELATVQGNLEDLRRDELIPFAQVTSIMGDELGVWPTGSANGFVTSHIRYSGFLRARERTPPISLSEQLGEMLALEEFQTWRHQGGLLMSDALGVRAIRRYYDPSDDSFLAQRIAGDAFQAGNDLLWLDQYGDETDSVAIKATIQFFQAQYLEKPDFAEAVDESVRRILMAKLLVFPLREYPFAEEPLETDDSWVTSSSWIKGPEKGGVKPSWIGFHFQDVLVEETKLDAFSPESLALKHDVVTRVAQGAITLLHSNRTPAGDLLATEPTVNDRLVIFTDSRPRNVCLLCTETSILETGTVEQAILRLFGPETTRQVAPNQITSFSLAQLSEVLNLSADGGLRLRMDRALNNADWIIFAMLDIDEEEHPPSDAVSQFLRQRGDLATEKQVVVLAFDAPFILDGTDVSKLAAYVGAYSPTSAFVETAVRALFRDLDFSGAPPVSVPGTRYSSLIERLEPDPDQVIPLTLFDEKRSDFALELFDVHLGDTIIIKAGPIVDRNGHHVPDGTPVQFLLKYSGSGLNLRTEPVPSVNGYGLAEVLLDRPEVLEVAATSIGSHTSVELQINVGTEDSALITSVEPGMPQPEEPAPEVQNPEPLSPPVTVPWFALEMGQFISSFLFLLSSLIAYYLYARRRLPSSVLLFRVSWASTVGTVVYLIYGVAGEPILGAAISDALYLWMVTPLVILASVLVLTTMHLRS